VRTFHPPIILDDLAEEWIGEVPWLDRDNPDTHDGTHLNWAKDGLVILRGLLPDILIDRYQDCWLDHNANRPMGWPYDTPYMHHDAVRRLCCWPVLGKLLESLIGEPMGVHLNLSGWRSTQRDWHQDGYLNPDTTRDFYAAVWFALDDIHPDSGPFEYIPGSHRLFPPIRQEHMLAALTEEERGPDWPKHSERILTPLFEQLLDEYQLKPTQFIAHRGDVLAWHPRLLHRGSVPKDPEMERRSLIAHYSSINHRPDMPQAWRREGENWHFPISQLDL
jgi:hypothetical protein